MKTFSTQNARILLSIGCYLLLAGPSVSQAQGRPIAVIKRHQVALLQENFGDTTHQVAASEGSDGADAADQPTAMPPRRPPAAADRRANPASSPSQAAVAYSAMIGLMEKFAPSLSAYYARSVADSSTFDFTQAIGFRAALDFMATPSLIFSTDVTFEREIGAAIERFIVYNANLSVTRTFELGPVGRLLPSVFVKLPTNEDDRRYSSYRGSLGTEIELKNASLLTIGEDHAFGASLGITAGRNLFQYDANQAGGLNRLWQHSLYAALFYSFGKSLALISKFENTWYWLRDGARGNNRYQLSTMLSVQPIDKVWLGLGLVSADRTFLYDQVTWNVSLYRPESTQFLFTITYLPRISRTNELAR